MVGQAVKEKNSIKSLERFQKMVTDLLAALSAGGERTALDADTPGQGDTTLVGDSTQADPGAEAKGQCTLLAG